MPRSIQACLLKEQSVKAGPTWYLSPLAGLGVSRQVSTVRVVAATLVIIPLRRFVPTNTIDPTDGYRTVVDLRGGEEFGVSVNVNPRAAFEVHIERQVYADKVQAVVTFDASASNDPQSSVQLTYAWSDNQTTSPSIAASTEVLNTVRIDPAAISGTWTVTLTVTADNRLTATAVVDIDVAETASLVEIPAL